MKLENEMGQDDKPPPGGLVDRAIAHILSWLSSGPTGHGTHPNCIQRKNVCFNGIVGIDYHSLSSRR